MTPLSEDLSPVMEVYAAQDVCFDGNFECANIH